MITFNPWVKLLILSELNTWTRSDHNKQVITLTGSSRYSRWLRSGNIRIWTPKPRIIMTTGSFFILYEKEQNPQITKGNFIDCLVIRKILICVTNAQVWQVCVQGGNSQNFLKQFLKIFITLGLKILGLVRLKVIFEADIIKG